MTRKGGLNGRLRRLQVADLTYHDDIRVLAQERAHGLGEGEAGLAVDVDLVYPWYHVLNGILDGHYVDLRGDQFVQDGALGSGLPGTGGPGGENDAVRLRNQ